MKKYLIVLLALAISTSTMAQLDFGPRFGISSSKVKVDEIETANEKIESGDAELGWHAGLFARAGIAGFYVQPELLFTFGGGNVRFIDVSTSAEELREYEFKKLDVPILLGKRFAKVVRVNAGPVFSLMLDATEIRPTEEIDFTDTYNNATVGFQAGVGVDLWKIVIDLKYEGNLSKLGDELEAVSGTTINTDQRNQQLILSVGIKII